MPLSVLVEAPIAFSGSDTAHEPDPVDLPGYVERVLERFPPDRDRLRSAGVCGACCPICCPGESVPTDKAAVVGEVRCRDDNSVRPALASPIPLASIPSR